MKMAVFWFVAPCSLVEVYQRFRGPWVTYRPDDGGSKDLWNVGKLLPDHMALQPRRQPSPLILKFTYSDTPLHFLQATTASIMTCCLKLMEIFCNWINVKIDRGHSPVWRSAPLSGTKLTLQLQCYYRMQCQGLPGVVVREQQRALCVRLHLTFRKSCRSWSNSFKI
jgi:hypothetical protein